MDMFNKARKKGILPDPSKATMFDVRRLLVDKEKDLAIEVYRDIFKTTHKEAEKAIEELERSIQA